MVQTIDAIRFNWLLKVKKELITIYFQTFFIKDYNIADFQSQWNVMKLNHLTLSQHHICEKINSLLFSDWFLPCSFHTASMPFPTNDYSKSYQIFSRVTKYPSSTTIFQNLETFVVKVYCASILVNGNSIGFFSFHKANYENFFFIWFKIW